MRKNFVWVILAGIALAAFVRLKAPVSDVSAETAPLFRSGSSSAQRIENYPLIDAASHRQVTIGDLKGRAKAIYVDVFASWCGPCQGLIPDVVALNDRLKDKGVLVVGIDINDRWQDMERDIQEQSIDYLVLHDAKQDGISPLIDTPAIPTVFILDGNTLEQKGRWIGGDDEKERNQILKSLGVDL